MKMTNKISIKSLLLGFATLLAGGMMSSCNDSFIFDDEGDCTVHYRVPVTFRHNILNADAISSQVRNVTLYVFDSQGHHVLTQTGSVPEDLKGTYYMDLDLEPGKYEIVAWATGKSPMTDAVNFQIGGNGDPNAPAELTATLPLNGQAGSYSQDKDITPLFWGHASDVECGAKDYGTITLPTIDLMKDTNIIKVILQNLDGSEMKEGDFRIEIEADNSRMDYMNNIIPFGKVSYGAWSSTLLKLDNGETKATEDEVPTGIMTENTTARIMTGDNTRLRVVRLSDNEPIINLKLAKYLIMVKGHYQGNYSDQEYLDRMDQHTLSFFIDADMNWHTAMGVNINGWTVVPDQEEDL